MPNLKVLLYGKTLAIAALEASLAPVAGMTVVRLDSRSGDLLETAHAEAPDCILFELGALGEGVAFTLLTEFSGTDLIGVDLETNRMLVLSVRQHTAPDTADLVRVIQGKGIAA